MTYVDMKYMALIIGYQHYSTNYWKNYFLYLLWLVSSINDYFLQIRFIFLQTPFYIFIGGFRVHEASAGVVTCLEIWQNAFSSDKLLTLANCKVIGDVYSLSANIETYGEVSKVGTSASGYTNGEQVLCLVGKSFCKYSTQQFQPQIEDI